MVWEKLKAVLLGEVERLADGFFGLDSMERWIGGIYGWVYAM
jgi:hypothetical protein